MRSIGSARTAAVIAATLAGSLVATGQEPRFERPQQELFAAGGTFVNAWADYDGDGDLDLFVGFDGTPNRLYRNDRGRFTEVGAAAGVADARPTRAVAWGDADGDGDPDLLVGFTPVAPPTPASGDATAPGTPPASVLRFYRNSNGTFRDDTAALGLSVANGAVRQPVWVDFDGDGDLDLFVAFRDKPNAMFRNEGARFVDVAADVGLADPRRTVGAVWFDHDHDGDLDVIVGNMDGDANGLFSNTNGKFVDVAERAGVAWGGRMPGEASNGTVRPCVADVNNDGRLDLFFANYGKNGLFLGRGDGTFEDVSARWGVAIDARFDSCAFGDFDNDGDLDLYVNGTVTGGKSYPDYLYRNTGTAFEDVTPSEIGSPDGDHGVQWADFDGDGALDLALTGVQKEGMHWLLRNTLRPTQAARGVNVRVLDAAGRPIPGVEISVQVSPGGGGAVRLADTGSGYNSQNDAPVHVVLPPGADTMTLRVLVRRDGKVQTAVTPPIEPGRLPSRTYEFRMPASGPNPARFRAHDIDAGFRGGYAVAVADINHDGRPDVIANSLQVHALAWYENPGRPAGQDGAWPAWPRHVIVPDTPSIVNLASTDLDGDGIPEIAFQSGFAMQAAKSPGVNWIARHQGDPRRPWAVQKIDAFPTSHHVVWADLDGDGRQELLNAPLVGANSIAPTYDQDRAPVFWYDQATWTRHVVTDGIPGIIHRVRPVQWDADAAEEVLVASFEGIVLYKAIGRGAAMTFRKTMISPGYPGGRAPRLGASDVGVGTMAGARFVAAVEPWHGNEVAVYHDAGGAWQRRVIFDKVSSGHEIAVADLNGDGRSDLIVNDNGRVIAERPDATPGVHVFYAPQDAVSGEWRYQRLEDTAAMNGCVGADLDGDGRTDVVCTGAGGVVRWYQNQRP